MKKLSLILILSTLTIALSAQKKLPAPIFKTIETKWYTVSLMDNWYKVPTGNNTTDNRGTHYLLRHTPHNDGKVCISIETHTTTHQIISPNMIKAENDIKLEYSYERYEAEVCNLREPKRKNISESYIFKKGDNTFEIFLFLDNDEIKNYQIYKELLNKVLQSFKLK